jgi:hypothetical protein
MPQARLTEPLQGPPVVSGGSETYYLLHRLWTNAVGKPGYVKKEWRWRPRS